MVSSNDACSDLSGPSNSSLNSWLLLRYAHLKLGFELAPLHQFSLIIVVQAFHFDGTRPVTHQHSNPVSSGRHCMLVGNRRNKGNSMGRREGVEKGERGRVCKKERRKEEAPAVGAPHQFLIRKTPKKQTPLGPVRPGGSFATGGRAWAGFLPCINSFEVQGVLF